MAESLNIISEAKLRGVNLPGVSAFSIPDVLRRKDARFGDAVMENLIRFAGVSSVLIITLIFVFLFKEAVQFFNTAHLGDMIGKMVYDPWDEKQVYNMMWQPVGDVPKYSFVPILLGSFLVSFPATLMAAVVGVGCAIYLSEIAPAKVREILKPTLELLAG